MKIVAEIGASHDGSFEKTLLLCRLAKEAGADAIKIQTWNEMTVSDAVIGSGPWAGVSIKDLYEQAKLLWEWHKPIFDYCKELGIEVFSTPFDKESVDFLETLDCPRYKIASFEILDLELIKYIASKNKPVIISTGMATQEEINNAGRAFFMGRLDQIQAKEDLTFLKCTSAYPAKPEFVNLKAMENTGWTYGLSDHTEGYLAPVLAVALGATMLEKHIGLDHSGLDGKFAMLPSEFAEMVKQVRLAQKMMGTHIGPTEAEKSSMYFRRSMWVVKDIEAGELLTDDNVKCLRPIGGLYPAKWPAYRGTPSKQVYKRGEALTIDKP